MNTLSDPKRAILEARRYSTLATHNEDGSIHLTPVWYLFEEDRFYVASASASRKVRNIAARPDATIMVECRQTGAESWVSACGRVEILKGDESRQLNLRIHRRYMTAAALEDPRMGAAFEAADDITLCLVPQKWRSWSAKDVDEQYFGGILGRDPEKWFLPMDR